MTVKRTLLILAAALIAVQLSCSYQQAALPPAQAVKIGDRMGDLTLKDIRYLPRSLNDFPKARAFVLVFTNTTCPLVQRYLPTLKRLDKDYRDQGVQFLAVNVGVDDSIMMMAAQAIEFEAEFPFVKDFDGQCARAAGVQRTPEVVVLDQDRRLRYRGRIDDQYRLGGTRAKPTRDDLKEAIEAVLAGREVTVKETLVDGCLISHPELPASEKPVTYAEHIAPLLQKHCQECHRPGTPAPFSLLTYKQAAAKANMIAEVVAEQRMPPWYAGPAHGEFINRRGLSAAERDLVQQWVRSGKPLGDETKLAKSRWEDAPSTGWVIGEPDLVLQTPQHELPASGDIAYKYAILPHLFLHDTWVQAIQIRPENPKSVHHANLLFVTAKEGFKSSNFITGFVPGGEPMNLDAGEGFRIPAGAGLGLQIHFVSTGKEEKCRLTVGLRYCNGKVDKQLRHKLLVDQKYAIPPGAAAHPVRGSKVLEHDAVGIALFSHMHVRGKDMSFLAHYPDGKSETLLVVPNYNFAWQMVYRWEPNKKRFPKGTRIEALAHYDNSAFNPYNPDPTATVRDGDQTYEEMMNGFFFYTDANEQLNLQVDPKTGRGRAKE